MTIKRCDRCGEPYTVRVDYGVKFGIWSSASSDLDAIRDPGNAFSRYDLCEDCAYAFMQWFNNTMYRKEICVVKKNHGRFIFDQKPKEETT